MIRVPLPGVDLSAPQIPLPEATAHYLVHVLRLTPGSAVMAFDTAGQEAPATLHQDAQDPARWRLRPTAPPSPGVTGAPITLIYGLPKGDKLDRVVRQITELGVAELILAQLSRSVVRLSGPRAQKRLARLTRIATEAARQAGRADQLTLRGPMTLAQAIEATAQHPLRAVLDPEGHQRFAQLTPMAPMALLVGPEGGLDPSELHALSEAGWIRARLGASVLRTETAAPVACALALAQLGVI